MSDLINLTRNLVLITSLLCYGCDRGGKNSSTPSSSEVPSASSSNSTASHSNTSLPIKPVIECPAGTNWNAVVSLGVENEYTEYSYQECLDSYGRSNGPFISFYKNSNNIRKVGEYQNDEFVNRVTYYNLDGSIMFTSEAGHFCPPGTTWTFSTYTDDDGLDFYTEKCIDSDGLDDGPFLSYYFKNQKIKRIEGQYKKGEKNGEFHYYDKSGSPSKNEKWIDGKLDLESSGVRVTMKILKMSRFYETISIDVEYSITLNDIQIYDIPYLFITVNAIDNNGNLMTSLKLLSISDIKNGDLTHREYYYNIENIKDIKDIKEFQIPKDLITSSVRFFQDSVSEEAIVGLDIDNKTPYKVTVVPNTKN